MAEKPVSDSGNSPLKVRGPIPVPARRSESSQLELGFWAAFEGPSIERGQMNARDFAPSLFGMATLVESSSEIYFGFPDAVSLQVRADFRRGSFAYGLAVVAMLGQQLLVNLSVSDLKVLLEGIGFLGRQPKSLLRLILDHGDRPIQQVEPTDGGLVNIHVEGDNNTVVVVPRVDERVARLLTSPQVREAVPQVVSPLSKPGITSYRVGSKKQTPTLRIRRTDLPKLRPPDSLKTELADGVATTAVELLSPNFVDGNKWRVAQGGDPFWVRMLDEEYLGAVDRGEKAFTKGDYLIVELRTKAYSSAEGLVVERDVLHVIDHKHRARQLGLG